MGSRSKTGNGRSIEQDSLDEEYHPEDEGAIPFAWPPTVIAGAPTNDPKIRPLKPIAPRRHRTRNRHLAQSMRGIA